MFDSVRCKMPLPKGDYPEPRPIQGWFQTKDTERPRQNHFTIEADGRLIQHGDFGVYGKSFIDHRIETPFHGELKFYHFDAKTEEWWEYGATFLNGLCEAISLLEYRQGHKRL